MSSSLQGAQSKDQIIQAYQGNGSPQECPVNRIDERAANIKKKFTEMGYFRKATPIDKSLIFLKCMKLNYLEIVKVLGTFTFVGGVCGGVIGAAGNAPGAGAGAAIGAGLGGAAGAYWCWHKGLYNKEEHIVSVVKDSTEYSLFKKQRTPEQYELFVAFFKNYCSKIDEKYEPRIQDFVCNICYDIPEYPVFSPYDVDRKTPYEKEELEKYLDKMKPIIEGQVEEYKVQCAKLGVEPSEDNIFQIKRQCCPLTTGYYTKEELIYDPEYVKTVIKTLKSIQQELKGTLSKKEDPVILKGVDALVDHYVKSYQTVTDRLVKALANDVFCIDGDIDLAHDASDKIGKMLMKV